MERKGIITITNLDSKEYPFSVGFWGFQEGSGTPCKDEKEVREQIAYLLKKHKGYNIEIKDERIKQVGLEKWVAN